MELSLQPKHLVITAMSYFASLWAEWLVSQRWPSVAEFVKDITGKAAGTAMAAWLVSA